MRNPLRALCGIADDPDPAPTAPRLVLQRLEHDDHATLGELMLDGRRICCTLENRPPRVPGVKEKGLSRIPAGVHRLGLRSVGRFYDQYTKRWAWHGPMVEILLPGWTAVLFHLGNYYFETEGCVLPGSEPGRHAEHGLAVWRSGEAYARAYPDLLKLGRRSADFEVRDEVAA